MLLLLFDKIMSDTWIPKNKKLRKVDYKSIESKLKYLPRISIYNKR